MAAYLPMASLGMQAAGAAMGTVGSYYSAQNTKSNLQMQANLADTNAQIAELGAQSALAQGAKEEQRSRLQTTALTKSQRVAMARALVVRPDVLLLDEPTANLDPYNVGLIERLVAEEQRATNMTVVWVTHDIFQARRVADRVAFLLGGRLVEVAEAETFFTCPATAQAAAFARGELVYDGDAANSLPILYRPVR